MTSTSRAVASIPRRYGKPAVASDQHAIGEGSERHLAFSLERAGCTTSADRQQQAVALWQEGNVRRIWPLLTIKLPAGTKCTAGEIREMRVLHMGYHTALRIALWLARGTARVIGVEPVCVTLAMGNGLSCSVVVCCGLATIDEVLRA